MSTPKFCSACGASLAEAARFCAGCGAQVGETASPAAAPAAQEPARDRPSAPSLDIVPAASAPAAAKATVSAPAVAAKRPAAQSRLAALASSDDDDDDDDDTSAALDDALPRPEASREQSGEKKPLPVGLIAMGSFIGVIAIGAIVIASDDELNARFRCNILGKRDACITEEDRMFEIEQQTKKEEIELMTHHYGGFDLSFTPANEVSFTIRQHRYEEDRADFVKRIREGGPDKRVRKSTKAGVYAEKKQPDGIIKGTVAFTGDNPAQVTYQPQPSKTIVLPLALPELPLLEREQVDGNGKRLTLEDIAAIEKAKENPKKDADGRLVKSPKLEIKTLALSTWAYEIELTAPGYKPRKVLFYEAPAPPDVDLKKMEAEGFASRAFKRKPDGRFIIDNAAFDLLPEPRTLWTRYIQAQKEIHCMKLSAEYKGKTPEAQKAAEELMWEQKAFTKEIMEIAQQNDADPEWMKYRDEQFKGYVCPKLMP